MVEVLGIISSAVGIASAFTACVDCFDLVQSGRHFGRDYTTESLKLECARYRLGSWGDAVNIYATPPFETICDNESTQELVKNVLFQILDLFRQSQKISERYSGTNSTAIASLPGDSQDNTAPGGITARLKGITSRRRKGPGLIKRMTWAVYHQEEFEQLINGIISLLDRLEELIAVPSRRSELTAFDVDGISQGASVHDLQLLGVAASTVDKTLEKAIRGGIVVSHRYTNITADEDAKVLNGDAVSDGWTGRQLDGAHFYNSVSARGRSKVVNGNMYGGKGLFSD